MSLNFGVDVRMIVLFRERDLSLNCITCIYILGGLLYLSFYVKLRIFISK